MILLFGCPVRAGQDVLLIGQLRVDHDAFQAAQKDFDQQRESGGMDGIETREYAAYVERLRQRVASDCAVLTAAQIKLPAGLDCPLQPVSVARPAAIDQQAEQTDAERAAALDARLNADLGEFDQRLLREQERVKAARPRSVSGGGQEGAKGGGGQRGDGTDSGDTGTATGSRGHHDDLARPPTVSGTAGGPGRQPDTKDRPDNIPDSSGDDVVARQLREAAERETDPELKKRLWDEYRKYRQGSR